MSVMFGINAVAAETPKKEGRFVRAKNRVASFTGNQVAKVKGGRLEQAYNVTSKYVGKASAFAKSCVPSFVGSSAALYAYNNVNLSSVKASASTKLDSAKSFASTKLASGKAKLASARDYAADSRFGKFVTSTGSSVANTSLVQTMNANRGTTVLFTAAGLILAKLAYDKYCELSTARSTTPASKAVVTVSKVAA